MRIDNKMRIALYQWQKQVHHALKKYRYVVVSAGRSSGKTQLAVYEILINALKKK